MSNFEAKHRPLNPNKLKPLPRFMLTLVVAALGACQKPSPPITAPVPGTETVLTFMPTNNGVRAYEFRADQPNKMMTGLNVGDVFNAYEAVNDTNLPPQQAALCADDIVGANLQNLQPVPADSQGPSSAREVLAPEGGLIIPIDSCGNLKNNSTPTASPSPEQTQTSAPIATLQTPIKKALINNENIGVVLGMFCASMLGIGVTFRALLALRGRKEKKSDGLEPVELKLLPRGTAVIDPRVINLSGQPIPVRLDLGDGQGERLVDFRPQVLVADTEDSHLMQRVLTALAKKIKRSDPDIIRGPVAPLMHHEGEHARASSGGAATIGFITETGPDGTPKIIGAAVRDVNPSPTPREQQKMFLAPKDPSKHDKKNAALASEEMGKKEGKK